MTTDTVVQAQIHVQSREDVAANWTLNNPVLYLGEQGLEMDTRQYKVGDGITDWINLPYWGGSIRPRVKFIPNITYEISPVDETYLLLFTSTSGCIVNGPTAGNPKLPVGFICHLHQEAPDPGGQVVFQTNAGDTIKAAIGAKTRVQYSSLSIIVQEVDVYKIIGDAVA